jgi:hypothetical protein
LQCHLNDTANAATQSKFRALIRASLLELQRHREALRTRRYGATMNALFQSTLAVALLTSSISVPVNGCESTRSAQSRKGHVLAQGVLVGIFRKER